MNGQREKAFLKKPVLINQPYCNNSKKKKKIVKWLAVIMQNQFKHQNLKSVKLATKKKKKKKTTTQNTQKLQPITTKSQSHKSLRNISYNTNQYFAPLQTSSLEKKGHKMDKLEGNH